jgi:hypothetical protein
LAGANQALVHYGFEIRRAASDDDGTVFYGLVNTKNDELSKLATTYEPAQLHYLKALIEAILKPPADGEKGRITRADAAGIRTQLAKDSHGASAGSGSGVVTTLSSAAADETIASLVANHWLSSSTRNGDLSLGMRSLMELKPFIESLCDSECTMCSEVVIRGQTCSNELCDTMMHFHCAKRWFENKPDKVCPTCTRPWGA